MPKISSEDSEASARMDSEDSFQQALAPVRIPAWPLWRCLGIPPFVIVVISLPFSILNMDTNTILNIWSVCLPIVMFGVIPGLAFHFSDTVRVRYLGRSLTFLVWSYVLGEIIVCISLSVGSCIAISLRS